MLSLNKSYKNRKVSLTIHCKYKYFDSAVQRAEDRRQKFAVCRLPFAVCRLPFAVCRLPFAVCRLPFAVNVKLNLSNVRTPRTFYLHLYLKVTVNFIENKKKCCGSKSRDGIKDLRYGISSFSKSRDIFFCRGLKVAWARIGRTNFKMAASG